MEINMSALPLLLFVPVDLFTSHAPCWVPPFESKSLSVCLRPVGLRRLFSFLSDVHHSRSPFLEVVLLWFGVFLILCFVCPMRFSYSQLLDPPDLGPWASMSIVGKDVMCLSKRHCNAMHVFLSLPDSSLSECGGDFTAWVQKIRKDRWHDLTAYPCFQTLWGFCFFSSPLLCLGVSKRTWQRKWDSDVFVWKLSSLDCVFICGVWIAGCSSGVLPPQQTPTSRLFWEVLSKVDCKIQGWTLSNRKQI